MNTFKYFFLCEAWEESDCIVTKCILHLKIIPVCISKGNVVYEAHLVVLLQLNCKDRYGKLPTEYDINLYQSHPLVLSFISQ